MVALLGALLIYQSSLAQGRDCTKEFKAVNKKSCDEASMGAKEKCAEGSVAINGGSETAQGMNDLHSVQVAELKSRWTTLAKAKSSCDDEWINCRAVCMKVMQCLGGETKRDPANATRYRAEDDRITPLYNDCNGRSQEFARNLNRQMYAIQEAIKKTESQAAQSASRPQ